MMTGPQLNMETEPLNEAVNGRCNWWATCTGSPASSGLFRWRCDGDKLMRNHCLSDVRVAAHEETTLQDVVDIALDLRKTIKQAYESSTCIDTKNWLIAIDDDLVNTIQQGKEIVEDKTDRLNVMIEDNYY